MLCSKCNHQNPEKAKFCAKCGEQLVVSQSQPQTPEKEVVSEVTSLGLSQNATSALCYLGGPVTGIIFLLLETKNKFVRFHALQSTIIFGGLLVLRFLLNFLPFSMRQFGSFINLVFNLAGVIFWIVLMVKAYQGERYQLPIIGEIAQKQSQGS